MLFFNCCWASKVLFVRTKCTSGASSTFEFLIQNTSCRCPRRPAHTTWTDFVSMPGWCIPLSLAAGRVSIVLVLPRIICCCHPVNTIPLSLPIGTGTRVPLGLPYHSQNWLRLRVAYQQCTQWIDSFLWFLLWLPPYFQVCWDMLVSSLFYFYGPGSPTGEGDLRMCSFQLPKLFWSGFMI